MWGACRVLRFSDLMLACLSNPFQLPNIADLVLPVSSNDIGKQHDSRTVCKLLRWPTPEQAWPLTDTDVSLRSHKLSSVASTEEPELAPLRAAVASVWTHRSRPPLQVGIAPFPLFLLAPICRRRSFRSRDCRYRGKCTVMISRHCWKNPTMRGLILSSPHSRARSTGLTLTRCLLTRGFFTKLPRCRGGSHSDTGDTSTFARLSRVKSNSYTIWRKTPKNSSISRWMLSVLIDFVSCVPPHLQNCDEPMLARSISCRDFQHPTTYHSDPPGLASRQFRCPSTTLGFA